MPFPFFGETDLLNFVLKVETEVPAGGEQQPPMKQVNQRQNPAIP
jgi:hypothetical protein